MHLQLVTSSNPVPPLHFTLGNLHATFSCNFFMQLNIPFLQATAHATGCRPEHKTFQTSHFMHVRCTLIHIRQLSCNFSMQLYQATVMQLYQATFMQLFHATLSGNFHATFPGNFIRQLSCNFSRQLSCNVSTITILLHARQLLCAELRMWVGG